MNNRKFFGNYRIATTPEGASVELAREASVITYKGEHVATGEPVTLMLIPQEAVNATSREQFETELHAAQLLDHPNIAAVRQFDADGELFVCASEYYDGETLQSWVDQHGPMPADTALRIGSQIATALAAAAFHAVPHGALKPSNIMIVPGTTPAGEWPLVKVLNFGLSKIRPHLPGIGEPAGPALAAGFSSPEHLVQGEVDFRSDVYSLGATLWFLVSGAAPISAAAVENSSGVHKSFRGLIAQMLSVSPAERPQDPLVLEEQLRDCLEQVERRQAIASKLGLPVIAATTAPAAAGTIEHAPRRPIPVKPLAIAALVLGVALLGAMMLPRMTDSLGRSEPKPIGVPIGVPEAETTAPAVAQTEPTETAAAPAPVVEEQAETPAVAAAAAPAAPRVTAGSAAFDGAIPEPAPPAAAVASAELQEIPAAPTPAPAQESRPVYARNTVRSAPAVEEPSAPAEGPAETADAPPSRTTDVASTTTRSSASTSDEEESSTSEVASTRSTPPPAAASSRSQRRTASRSSRRTANPDSLPVRRALPADDVENSLPALPAGSQRARYMGTDENGAMVFSVPSSSEPVYAAPPAANIRRLSPRQRLRRVLFGRNEEVRPAEPVDEIYEDEN